MSVHQAFIKKSVEKSSKFLVHEVESSKVNVKSQPQVIVDIRQGNIKFQNDNISVNRVYVKAYDSGNMSHVGWVVNDGIHACLLCQSQFGLITGRHHCRSCGLLVCQRCSPHRTLVFDFELLGPLRICNNCTTSNTVGQTMLHKNDHFGVSLNVERAMFDCEMAAAVALTAAGGEYEPSDRSTLTEDRLSIMNPPMVSNTSVMSGLTDLESSSSSAQHKTVASTEAVVVLTCPTPGFIIKTRQTGSSKDKVFVNVLHHEAVEDADLSLFQEPIVGADGTETCCEIVPRILLGQTVSSTTDKEGSSSQLYNVVVNSEYFSPSSVTAAVRVTDSVAVQKILRAINKHYGTSVHEEMFIFPRVKSGIKGDAFTELRCVANTQSVDMHVTKCLQRSDSFVSTSTAMTSPVFAPLDKRRSLRSSLLSFGMSNSDMRSVADSETDERVITPGASSSNKRMSFFTSRPSVSEPVSVVPELSAAMFVNLKGGNLSAEEATALKEASATDTSLLVGWQISVKASNQDNQDEGDNEKIFVVTGINKTLARKTEFRLSVLHQEDLYAKLKRSTQKVGLEFTPLRKVLFLPTNLSSLVGIAE